MDQEQLDFLKLVTPPALDTERDTGIPAAITIAQAILESSAKGKDGLYHWGASVLFRTARNPFGIKAGKWSAPYLYATINEPTTEVVAHNGHEQIEHVMAPFAMFGSLAKAFLCHAHLFLDHDRYAATKAAALARPVNLEALANAIQACGYSTNPRYGRELMNIVQAYHLDSPAALLAYANGTHDTGVSA